MLKGVPLLLCIGLVKVFRIPDLFKVGTVVHVTPEMIRQHLILRAKEHKFLDFLVLLLLHFEELVLGLARLVPERTVHSELVEVVDLVLYLLPVGPH